METSTPGFNALKPKPQELHWKALGVRTMVTKIYFPTLLKFVFVWSSKGQRLHLKGWELLGSAVFTAVMTFLSRVSGRKLENQKAHRHA